MPDEDEIVADFADLLGGMVVEGKLELASQRDIGSLALQLVALLGNDPAADLGEWLVEQDEVVELYLDSAELLERAAPIFHRMRHGDPAHQWNEALAAAIHADPDDVQARLVYADWLEQAGDPRGELIAIQVKLAITPDDPALRQGEGLLLQRFRNHLQGALPDIEGCHVTWRYGYIDELTIDATFLDSMLGHPSLRLLRRLTINRSCLHLGTLMERATLPATLKSLVFDVGAWLWENGTLELTTIVRGLHQLERLEISGVTRANLDLEAVELPRLKTFAVNQTTLDVQREGDIWLRKLPALEELVLDRMVADLSPSLLEAPPPLLSILRLTRPNRSTFDWLQALVDSKLMLQLRTLDLRDAASTNLVAVLTRNAARLEHLELLDLRQRGGAQLTLLALTALGPFVRIGLDDSTARPDRNPDDEYDDEYDDDDEDPDLADSMYDMPAIDPDAVPEEEVEEEPEDAEPEDVGADLGAPLEEREQEPE